MSANEETPSTAPKTDMASTPEADEVTQAGTATSSVSKKPPTDAPDTAEAPTPPSRKPTSSIFIVLLLAISLLYVITSTERRYNSAHDKNLLIKKQILCLSLEKNLQAQLKTSSDNSHIRVTTEVLKQCEKSLYDNPDFSGYADKLTAGKDAEEISNAKLLERFFLSPGGAGNFVYKIGLAALYAIIILCAALILIAIIESQGLIHHDSNDIIDKLKNWMGNKNDDKDKNKSALPGLLATALFVGPATMGGIMAIHTEPLNISMTTSGKVGTGGNNRDVHVGGEGKPINIPVKLDIDSVSASLPITLKPVATPASIDVNVNGGAKTETTLQHQVNVALPTLEAKLVSNFQIQDELNTRLIDLLKKPAPTIALDTGSISDAINRLSCAQEKNFKTLSDLSEELIKLSKSEKSKVTSGGLECSIKGICPPMH
ncbi:hypothetical protein H8L32_11515 [Undibacterium sp. CY18W]|uniref:Uncharacterized protein n=1 Tax=Undibacterium hunanense TaxID=2762292 RepID=A0ABR6ZQF3_9BURK|nr:hypothetical protein [Undibacterium hunanense]MBC3918107.1 hypothetical protein [Undibacterium hunanense]